MFSLIGTLVVGLIVGALAKWFSGANGPGGIIGTIIVGIIGAAVARFVGREAFGWYDDGSAPGWIMSVLGAMLVVWVWSRLARR